MTSTFADRIDGISGSTAFKAPCRVATTANVTLSGLQTIDGVTLAADDRVLVKDQTNATQNGIYVAGVSAWSRASDFDGNRDVKKGTIFYVHSGTTNADTFWRVTAADPITIGTSSITIAAAINNLPYFSPTSVTTAATVGNGFYLDDDTVLGVAVAGVKQVQFEDSMWAENMGQSIGYWRMGGGNSFGGLEAHAILKCASDVLDHCTMRLESQGEFGMIHFVHRKYVNLTVGSAGSNTDTDNQLNTYVLIQGNIPGSSPLISAQRSDSGISNAHGLVFYTTGTGNLDFYTDNLGSHAFQIVRAASGVNRVKVTPGTTGNGAQVGVAGSDTNAELILEGKGTSLVRIKGGGATSLTCSGSATAANYIDISGATSGNSPAISVQGTGTAATRGLTIYTSGQGDINFFTDNTAVKVLSLDRVASGVNNLVIRPGATGVPAELAVEGSDTNVDLLLSAKGTGTVRFGTHSAIGAETVTGFITVKDSAGNSRKLAVVS